jgi:hypothetical protein
MTVLSPAVNSDMEQYEGALRHQEIHHGEDMRNRPM